MGVRESGQSVTNAVMMGPLVRNAMDRSQSLWTDVSRMLWPCALGLAAGGALLLWRGSTAVWIVAGAVAIAAFAASFLTRRGSLSLLEPRT